MDAFASILSSEIARKKPTTSKGDSKPSSTTSTSSASKYLRRADIEKARKDEYLTNQARLDRERAEKAAKKRQAEEEAAETHKRTLDKKRKIREDKEEARREAEEQYEEERKVKERLKKAGSNTNGTTEDGKDASTTTTTTTSAQDIEDLDEETVKVRLRDLSMPIKLFGESRLQRLKRLHNLVHPASPSSTPRRPATPPPLSGGELLIEPSDITKRPEYVYRQLLGWFHLVLYEWNVALGERPTEVKESYQGKQATGAMKQAMEYMQPLFRHLKRNDLDEEIFQRVVELVVEAQARRYVKANDVYLKLSIGNAAWPIGVTMVGIHERSAREKLHEKGKSAHIMSDEATRKYLQSIKRCLNFAQSRWPPTDSMQIMG